MNSWLHSHAYLIGKSHIKNNISCQDYANTYQDDIFQITALSDGCGSSKHSDLGSNIVVEQTIKMLINSFDEITSLNPVESRKFILDHINKQLQLKADELNVNIKELNATLLFVAIKDNEDLILGHLGDGFIGSIKNNALEIKSLEKKDEEVNGTHYTTSQNALAQFDLRKGKLSDYQGFILMSDGSGDALIDSRIPFEKQFINSVAGILEFVASNDTDSSQKMLQDYIVKVRDHIQSGDDCSLAIMVREQTKIKTIETYHVPKPTPKPITERPLKEIYTFNSDYTKLYLYVSDKFERLTKESLDKIFISKLIDNILKATPKPKIESSHAILNLIELQLKHLLFDGYLYENK